MMVCCVCMYLVCVVCACRAVFDVQWCVRAQDCSCACTYSVSTLQVQPQQAKKWAYEFHSYQSLAQCWYGQCGGDPGESGTHHLQ